METLVVMETLVIMEALCHGELASLDLQNCLFMNSAVHRWVDGGLTQTPDLGLDCI